MNPARILITEDESIIAEDLRVVLNAMGHVVLGVASSANEAIDLARSEQPDIVLMDIKLRGGSDGIDAAEVLRKEYGPPVVYLTSHADARTIERAGRTEPLGYLVKPFREEALRATLEMALCRHRAEEELRRMERWLWTTLESVGDAVLATDVDGRLTFINRVGEQLTGWVRGDALGRPAGEVLRVRASEAEPQFLDIVSRTLEQRRVTLLDEPVRLERRTGQWVLIDDSAAPIQDEHGQTIGAVVVFRDCTERVRADEQRRDMEHRLLAAQKQESLQVLAAGVAHDFNNLLTAVLGHASLCRDDLPAGSPLRRHVEEILGATERASRLCRQMQTFAAKDRPAPKAVDLDTLAQGITALLEVAIDARARLVTNLGKDLPLAAGDPGQIEQVLMNLVINANEALEGRGGAITITTGHETLSQSALRRAILPCEAAPGEFVFFEVADTGCGIPPEVLERIFEPFFSTKFSGRGLGLATVHGIVRTHRGALFVSSAPGAGSSFHVALPVASADSGATGSAAAQRLDGQQTRYRGSGRVLLVEDEAAVLEAVARMFTSCGFEVVQAIDGEQALVRFAEHGSSLRLAVLDLTMPGFDGAQLLTYLRLKAPELPVIVMSGHGDGEVNKRLAEQLPDGLLRKPFGLAELSAQLQRVLGAQPGPRGPGPGA